MTAPAPRVGGLGPGVALTMTILAASSTAALRAQAPPSSEACVACHLELSEDRLAAPARAYPVDVHADRGFGCLDCHGPAGDGGPPGGPAFLRAPAREDVPGLCGRCHADPAFMRDFAPSLRVDQVAEYRTSVHGRLLEEGDPDVATCTSCHPAHRIRPPSDPLSTVHPLNVAGLCGSCHGDPELMSSRDHRWDELDEYRTSVHALLLYEEGDLSAPTCNDCHGNHGAAPPGLSSVRNVCGQCHATMADAFAASGHVEPFDVDARPGCATCHGNHAVQRPEDADLVARGTTVCGACHDDPDDPSGGEFAAMAALVDSLVASREAALAVLAEAQNRGMHVDRALFELEDVNNALTQARSAIHTFRVEPVAEAVTPGLEITRTAAERGFAALDEHRFRRIGLAVSTLVIIALITGLVLKIREIERRASRRQDAVTEPAPEGAP